MDRDFGEHREDGEQEEREKLNGGERNKRAERDG